MNKLQHNTVRVLSSVLSAAMISICTMWVAPASVQASQSQTQLAREIPIEVSIEGSIPEWSTTPFVLNGTTYVPLRETAQLLGATIRWNTANRASELNIHGDIILHRPGTAVFDVNGYKLQAPSVSLTRQGTTMVPLKSLADALKATVKYTTQPVKTIDISQDPVSMLTKETEDVDNYLKTQGYSGMVLVAKNGEVLLRKGYGYGDEYKLNRPDKETRIASLTKSFTAAAIMKLTEEGKLRLDDTLETYVPGFPGGKEITLHMLLSHTSGAPANFTRTKGMTLQQTVDELKKKNLDFKPGTDFKYSNGGYVLLAYIIEHTSGTSYGEYLNQSFISPLGMTHTGEATPTKNITKGYVESKGQWKLADYYVSQSGTGTLYSTVDDLLKWDNALNTEQLLSQESLEQMFTPYSSKNYGYGWMIKNLDGDKIVFHNGSGTGYSTGLSREPDGGITIILLGNHAGMDMLNLLDGVRDNVH
ncbi:serine hydrolase [Paenibacillus anaericanus]|nr:serine hydrolase [Paenibacillus anaericanus]